MRLIVWTILIWSEVVLILGQQRFPGSSQQQGSPNIIRSQNPSLPGMRDNPSYLIVTSQIVRPGSVFGVVVNMLEPSATTNVVASVARDGVEIAAAEGTLHGIDSETLLLRIPQTSVQGQYKLRVVGTSNDILGPQFIETRDLKFSPRFLTIVVYTSRPVYTADMKMLIRVIILNMDLKPFNEPVTINVVDPKGNIMASYRSVQLNVGVARVTYTVPEFPPLGWWKIQVLTYSQIETYDVLVEKFYNPKYEIDVLIPEFIISTETTLSGEIGAAYLAEGQIVGNLTRRLLVTRPKSRDKPILIDEEKIPYFAGGHEFEYDLAVIQQQVPLEAGTQLKVEAVVQEQFLNIAYPCSSITTIIDSKVVVDFLGPAPKVFKPGMPFRIYVSVSYDDMEPLPEEKLTHATLEISSIITFGNGQVQPGEVIREQVPEDGVLKVEFDVPLRARFMVIKALYQDNDGDSAGAETAAVLSSPQDNRAIHVYSKDSMANIGEYIVVHVQANFYMKRFWYMVISKGLILHASEELNEPLRNPIKTISIPVASSMAPNFEVFVYHITLDGMIFADSVSIPINKFDRQKPNLRVNPYKDKTGNTVELGVIHIPGSFYGITSRDAATFCYKCGADLTKATVLENLFGFNEGTERITKMKRIHRGADPDQVVYYDTSNIGIDTTETFRLSYLLIMTDGVVPVADQCNATQGSLSCRDGRCFPRRKKCDGVRDCPNGIDEIGCDRKTSGLDMDLKMYRIHRKSRTEQFYDEEGDWGWIDFNTDYDDFFNREVSVRPSEWYVTGFAMNLVYGLSIQDKPILYNGVRPFFMTIEAPERCKSGEQIGVRVDVFNNQQFGMFATVVISGSEDYKFIHVEEAGYVSSYNPRTSFGEHQHQIWIEPNDQVATYMPIVFTKLGEIEVTVQVWTTIGKGEDSITVTVVPDGTKQRFHTSMLLDMRTHPQLIKYLDINVTETPVIAYQKWRRYVYGSPQAKFSAVGDVFGPVFPPEKIRTDVLIDKPYFNAEGLAFTFGATVWMLHYLRLTNQLTKEALYPSFEHMRYYYGSLMNFCKDDGSFFMWDTWGTTMERAESSVWLTAYIVRVFQYAVFPDWENVFYIDPHVISSAVLWLIKQQTPDGSFVETARRPLNTRMDPSMNNRNHPRYHNIPLTAFVLIAIGQIDDLPGQLRTKASAAKSLATRFLEKNYNSIQDRYEMAIVAYALVFVNSVEQEEVFQKLDRMKTRAEGRFYWSQYTRPLGEIYTDNQRDLRLPRLPFKDDALSVEATAYALLVYIAKEGLWQERIVDWLNTMRGTDGGFISSQDTLVAMQALTEFTFRARLRDITDMRINMRSSSSPNVSDTLLLTPRNLATLQSVDIPNVWGHLEVYSQGAGLAITQLDYSYSVDRPELLVPPAQRAFDLEIYTKYYGKNNSHIDITSCQRWVLQSEGPHSGVAVFELDVPTGYYQDIPKFFDYVNSGKVRNLRRMSIDDRKVYAYFDYLDGNFTCIKFTVQRWFPVANLSQYNLARIYEYHAPERYNESIFHTYNVYVMDICQVCGSYQCPYCPYYSDSSMKFANIALIIACFVSVLFHTDEIAGWTRYRWSKSAKNPSLNVGTSIGAILTVSVIALIAVVSRDAFSLT